jgi:hypothetical protein
MVDMSLAGAVLVLHSQVPERMSIDFVVRPAWGLVNISTHAGSALEAPCRALRLDWQQDCSLLKIVFIRPPAAAKHCLSSCTCLGQVCHAACSWCFVSQRIVRFGVLHVHAGDVA